MSESEVQAATREVAQQEVRRFAYLLSDEIGGTPMRADGNMNARDLWRALDETIKRWERGDDA